MSIKGFSIITVLLLLMLKPSLQEGAAVEYQWIIKPVYEKAESFSEGAAPVMINRKWGYVSTGGELVIDAKYDEAGDFYNGTASVLAKGMRGIINIKGMPVILTADDSDRYFGDGIAVIKTEGGFGYLKSDGTLLLNPLYEDALSFSEGFAPVKINGKYGYINMKGGVVINPKFEKGSVFSEGLAAVRINGKWGYINRRGVVVIKTVYMGAGNFSSGYADVRTEAGYGYINKKGSIIITPQFEDAKPFSEYAAAVKFQGVWGYIRIPGFANGGVRIKSPDKKNKYKENVSGVLNGADNREKVKTGEEFLMESSGRGVTTGKLKGVNKNGVRGENKDLTGRDIETGGAIPVIKGMEYAGVVSEVNEGQVIITDNSTGAKVYLGAWCIVAVEGESVILDSGTPITTVAKCEPRNGFLEKIKPGMRVYKKIK